MMNFETVKIPQFEDYKYIELGSSKIVVSKEELVKLEKEYSGRFNLTSLSPNSKVYFAGNTDFPRYRFRDYAKDKNISVIRDINKADVIIADKKSFNKHLENFKGYRYKTRNGKSGLDYFKYNYGAAYFDLEEVNTRFEFIEEVLNSGKKVIDVADLLKIVCKDRMVFDCDMAVNIQRMLASSVQDDIDLALEMIANSDLEENVVKNYILLCQAMGQTKVKYSKFITSVNFKTVASYYANLLLSYENYQRDINSVLNQLIDHDFKFGQSDIEFIDLCVTQYIKEQFQNIISKVTIDYQLELKEYVEPVVQSLSFTGLPRE